MQIAGAFSSANLKKSQWTKNGNTLSQPISAKHLISNRSKPFNKAIIEEVTKEHFFTKGDLIRRSSADRTETSFASIEGGGNHAKNFRLRNGRNQGNFGKRSQSLPGVQKSERIKLDVPKDCKVLCFCKQKHMQMPPVMNPTKGERDTRASPFNMSGFAPSNTNLSRVSEP